MAKEKLKEYFQKTKEIKNLEFKLIFSSIILFILMLVMYQNAYGLVEEVNAEFSYRNYLQNPLGIEGLDVDTNYKFPFLLKVIVTISFFLLLNTGYYTLILFKRYRAKYKKEKINKQKEVS